MPRYRIEFRSYGIGADRTPVPRVGMGAAHNFIAVVKIIPGMKEPRLVAELHADSADKNGKKIPFDATGRGFLKYERRDPGEPTIEYKDSHRHPHFVLFEGTKAEVEERLNAAHEWSEVA